MPHTYAGSIAGGKGSECCSYSEWQGSRGVAKWDAK